MIPIPTLFLKDSTGKVIPKINPSCKWVLEGEGFLTVKIDGLGARVIRDSKGTMMLQKAYKTQSGETIYVDVDLALSLNAPFKEAWNNLVSTHFDGYYVVYGFGVKGNPHNFTKTQMIKVCPAAADLIIPDETIPRKGVVVERLYNKIYDELSDPATDVEGLVWHLEDAGVDLKAAAQITKKDFGLKWGK